MSFREMRLFTEIMRSLGYPRVISMENFRTPNFLLIAEILRWLIERYDSYADLPVCLDSEQDRVLFIKVATHLISSKACIRLNSKKLYQADGFAVRELMKITKILYEALNNSHTEFKDEQNILNISETFDVAKIKQLHEARSLCSQLASSGASLHSLLNKEIDLKELRDFSLRRQLDSEYVEKSLAAAKNAVKIQTEKIQSSLTNIAADEMNLDAKIEKKRSELERNRKRLVTLQSVRPAYMEEYEQLEEELSSLYAIYLTRFRNLAFLENQYEYLLHNISQMNEDAEITLKSIADQMKISSFRDDENQRTVLNSGGDGRYKMDTFNLKNTISANNFNNELGDDDDDEEDDDDDEEDDLMNDQDDGDEDDEDIVVHGDSFRYKGDMGYTKREAVRNQLTPGWSPSRHRIPGAGNCGRIQSTYNDENFQSSANNYPPSDIDESYPKRNDHRPTKRSQKRSSPVAIIRNEDSQDCMGNNDYVYERGIMKERLCEQTATNKQAYSKNTVQPEENEDDDF